MVSCMLALKELESKARTRMCWCCWGRVAEAHEACCDPAWVAYASECIGGVSSDGAKPADSRAFWKSFSWDPEKGNVTADVMFVIGWLSSVSRVVWTLDRNVVRIVLSSGEFDVECGVIHRDIKSMYSASPGIWARSIVVPFGYRAAATACNVVKWTPMLGVASSSSALVWSLTVSSTMGI